MKAQDSLEQILDNAEDALSKGNAEVALELCEQVLEIQSEHAGAWYTKGEALRALNALEDSADAYRRAALIRPDHSASWASLALASFEILDMDEAWRAINRALREDENNPHCWWVRSLLLEWRGDQSGARRATVHAEWLDPVNFPLPPRLGDAEVDQIVSEAIAELHPTLQDFLSNVPIILEEIPSQETLLSYDPPASPLDLLGYFSGLSLMERSLEDPWSNLPPTIVLFRRNLERTSLDRAELIHQLRVTLYHEVGHFLGLSEEDLEARGLD
jgi:predicted Zn-dependent protease with MMP-like domain